MVRQGCSWLRTVIASVAAAIAASGFAVRLRRRPTSSRRIRAGHHLGQLHGNGLAVRVRMESALSHDSAREAAAEFIGVDESVGPTCTPVPVWHRHPAKSGAADGWW